MLISKQDLPYKYVYICSLRRTIDQQLLMFDSLILNLLFATCSKGLPG